MKIMNRVFAAAFVALLIFASHSSAELEAVEPAAAACETSETHSDCP